MEEAPFWVVNVRGTKSVGGDNLIDLRSIVCLQAMSPIIDGGTRKVRLVGPNIGIEAEMTGTDYRELRAVFVRTRAAFATNGMPLGSKVSREGRE
jgi:hypothetical protein